jgi:uncharacterized membrane protein YfcA
MDISAIFLVAFVVFLTGISKSAFAGALGVFAVPLLMLKLPATQAIALMLPILIIADILSVKSYWNKWDTKLLYSLIPGAAFGVVLAHLVVNYVSMRQLSNTIAVICIVFALRSLLLANTKIALLNNKFGALLMSGLSGFSSTLVHAGGPPLMIYLTSLGLSPMTFIATASVFYASMNLLKLIGFSALGILSLSELSTALLFVPLALLGNWAGLFIQNKLDIKTFSKAISLLLLILGGWLLYH